MNLSNLMQCTLILGTLISRIGLLYRDSGSYQKLYVQASVLNDLSVFVLCVSDFEIVCRLA